MSDETAAGGERRGAIINWHWRRIVGRYRRSTILRHAVRLNSALASRAESDCAAYGL